MQTWIRGGRGAGPRWARWVAAVYVIGFVEGTGAHLYDVLTGGLHAYQGMPLPCQLLFHALLVLDPLAALLVVRGHPAGPLLGAAVMVADLVANWWICWDSLIRRPLDYLQPVGLLPMTLFGLFVFGTVLPLRRAFRRAAPRPAAPARAQEA
ncbi:hypothetical protein AB0O91_18985 [Kitasatospora sp. NPDC089797]|uniref:hypothetical protein n=1 Tax=Kitasatospora sp. NPDC089797 TaxID=3155298 RepID=UPI003428D285